MIDTGELSDSLKEAIKQQYPWMRFLNAPETLSYYEVKQLGAESAVGEVVVYCDADCVYTKGWLRSLLTPMEDPDIEIVAGETTIPVTGIYSMAMALNYMLHRQDPKSHLTSAGFYYMNNVAIRRQILVENPIVPHLPIYRGNCSIHSRLLRKKGYRIWKQFSAKAQHAPPNGLQHYIWRFLVMGHDHYWLDIYYSELNQDNVRRFEQGASKDIQSLDTQKQDQSKVSTIRKHPTVRIFQKLRYIFRHIRIYVGEEPQTIWFLPFALPIVILSQFLIMIGRIVTGFSPHIILKAYLSNFEPAYKEKVFDEILEKENKIFSAIQ